MRMDVREGKCGRDKNRERLERKERKAKEKKLYRPRQHYYYRYSMVGEVSRKDVEQERWRNKVKRETGKQRDFDMKKTRL